MDRPTLEALQRLMDVLRPLADGWLRVTAWMDGAAHDADLNTLGTDDPRRRLRPAR